MGPQARHGVLSELRYSRCVRPFRNPHGEDVSPTSNLEFLVCGSPHQASASARRLGCILKSPTAQEQARQEGTFFYSTVAPGADPLRGPRSLFSFQLRAGRRAASFFGWPVFADWSRDARIVETSGGLSASVRAATGLDGVSAKK